MDAHGSTVPASTSATLTAGQPIAVDDTWEQPWGERRFVRDRYNELRATFVEKDHDRRRFDVVFRVFDDGVGCRYDVPAQPALRTAEIVQELTEFAVARPATAWCSAARPPSPST